MWLDTTAYIQVQFNSMLFIMFNAKQQTFINYNGRRI